MLFGPQQRMNMGRLTEDCGGAFTKESPDQLQSQINCGDGMSQKELRGGQSLSELWLINRFKS